MEGILKEKEKLPSTRELAKEINASRNAVIEAYEQLIAEGYLYSKAGSGTYVSSGAVLKGAANEEHMYDFIFSLFSVYSYYIFINYNS